MGQSQLPRSPINDEDYERGVRYYSDAALERVIGAMVLRNDVDLCELRDRLENLACHFVVTAHGSHRDHMTASDEVRYWQATQAGLRKALDKLDRAQMAFGHNFYLAGNLEWASEVLKNNRGRLHDVEPEVIEFDLPLGKFRDLVWHHSIQIEKAVESARWLHDLVEVAVQEAEDKKASHGAPQRDERRRWFYRALAGIIDAYCVGNRMIAKRNRDTDDDEGPLADFLFAVFEPLGITITRAGLVAGYQRALD